ncbi:hypothetical protein [Microbacterium profundi]
MDDDALITWAGDDFPTPIQAIADRTGANRIPEITVEQGWWPLLVRLDARLAAIDPDYTIREVAPVDGRLRFEIEGGASTEGLRAAIHDAEEEAAHTCEICGQPGARLNTFHAWYWVLCDKHAPIITWDKS